MKKLSELLDLARKNSKIVAVAAAEDEIVLKAVKEAVNEEIADFILFGDETKINNLLDKIRLDKGYKIIHCETTQIAIEKAVKAVSSGQADILMKGHIKTAAILGVYLKEEFGLKTGKTISLVSVFEVPGHKKLLYVSDAGMIIAPTLKQKADLISNSTEVARATGIDNPKVAILGAVEVVNEKMPVTIEAAILSKMSDRNQLHGSLVDGPFALDNAVSEEAARQKGINSPVAGNADILIMPDIEAGNIFYKTLVFLANASVASTVVGGKIPIILTSRADSDLTKLYSIALNVLIAGRFNA